MIPFGKIRSNWDKVRLKINEKMITFAGSRGSLPEHWNKAIRLVEEGKILIKKLVTHTIPFESLPDTIEQLSKRSRINGKICLKAVIDMNLKCSK